MIDNYVNSLETLVLYVYAGGNRVSADAEPTATAVDVDTGDSVTLTAVQTVDSGDGYDYYTVTLDPSEVTVTREVVVTWTYDYNGSTYQRVDVVKVVRPYFEAGELWSRYPQFDVGGAEAKTYDQLQNIERMVRMTINTYCNQRFQDFGLETRRVRGSGTNFLQLPDRIYYLESVKSDSLVLFDRDGSGDVVTETAVWYKDEPFLISKRGTQSPTITFSDKDPVVSTIERTRSLFRSDRLYEVTAKYGWERLPQEVHEAAILLAYEALQMDDRYRQKNITVVRSADYRLEFGGDHHSTTGNVDADHLLSDYINTGVHIF